MIKIKSRFLIFFLLLILLTAGNFAETEPKPQHLIYSTYLGGTGYERYGSSVKIAVDEKGNIYVTGQTDSFDFPVTYGAYDTSYNGDGDLFITKFNSAGTEIIWSMYLGGSGEDYPRGIAIDPDGNVYITGGTSSLDFPTTSGAYDITYNGIRDAFIAKINSTGTDIIYSTYLGGAYGDCGEDIAVDANGNACVIGYTGSSDFPVTHGAYDVTYNGNGDAFVIKLNSTGTDLLYSTFLGGSDESFDSGKGITVDADGNVYVTGLTHSSDFPTTPGAYDTTHNGNSDVFVTKLNPTGTDLLYSTFLGGNSLDKGCGISIDEEGNAYVAGETSRDFPTTYGAYDTSNNGWTDLFITKLNSTGTGLIYSTYLGGSSWDYYVAITVDVKGNVYVTGCTESFDFPTTSGAYDTTPDENGDVFIVKLNSTGTDLIYSTFLGGTYLDYGQDIAINGSGNVYIAGYTESSDFPTTPGAYDTTYNGNGDVFITKILISVNLTISATTGGTTDPEPGTYTYEEGTEVIVKAIPNDEYEFKSWSGDAGGTDNPITIVLDKDKSVTANFKVLSSPDEPDEPDRCFIATAAYGSPLHVHVDVLRDFRDKYLMPNKFGRKLVNFYYKHSPLVAELIAQNKVLKTTVRIALLPLIAFSYLMIHFGPIITLAMLILIFLLPVLSILLYQKKLKHL